MRERWQQLSTRERMMVSLLTVFMIVVCIYLLLFRPFWHALRTQRQQYQQNIALVNYLTSATSQIKLLSRSTTVPTPVTDNDLLGYLEDTLDNSGLANQKKNIRQVDKSHVEIHWDSIPFDQLTDWIDTVWRTSSIEVSQLQATPTAITGIAKVTCQFQNTKGTAAK